MYMSVMMSVATCSTAIAAGMVLLGRRYDTNFVVARAFYAICKRVMNIRVEVVEGEEYLSTRSPAVYMMNHQSMLDLLIIGR
jgi:lysophosphatidate acyltransferase